ncbi:TPA: microcompartment protein, partial [Klebsiella pneumoniae]|nr:microcompartment protein [Klebsiella pneumoniae]
PAPDVAVTEENTALTDAPSHSTERVTCNLCLDPHCPRQKGDPRSQCLHAGKRGDA